MTDPPWLEAKRAVGIANFAATMPSSERIRMVATDLDGTLLRRDGSLSSRTIAAVKAAKAAGVDVVLVTARPPRWVDEIAAALSCYPLVVCSNGAFIYNVGRRELVVQHVIAPPDAVEILRRLGEVLAGIVLAVEAGLRFGQEPRFVDQWEIPNDTLIAPADQLIAEPVSKLVVQYSGSGDHWENLRRAQHAVGALAEVTSSGGPPALIEVAARGVSKASGIATLTNALGISSGAVMACGDMPNDLPMLAWAGRSVAPSSAHPAVLAVVDVITTDCDSDGIAIAIEDLLRRECLVPDPSCGEHNVTRQDSV